MDVTIVAAPVLLCHRVRMRNILTYSGGGLEKVVTTRLADNWFEAYEKILVVPVWNNFNLIDTSTNRSVMLAGEAAETAIKETSDKVVLGKYQGKMVIGVAVTKERLARTLVKISKNGRFLDLREIGSRLKREDAGILAYARGMIHWHKSHQYCNLCGALTKQKQGGHVRYCLNKSCGADKFPRVDPAVIMLVTYEDECGSKCLLGRNPKWPSGCYSTLAGFVEPGESIEEAVAREVKEEVGIETFDICYLASQPWPFPSSLMLGFRAKAKTVKLTINNAELEDAQWFTRDQIKGFGTWGRGGIGYKKPRPDSIAHWLIMTWLHEN